MPVASWVEVGEVFFVYGQALGAQLIENLSVLDRVPGYDAIGYKVEAQRLLGLLLGLALGDVALVGER